MQNNSSSSEKEKSPQKSKSSSLSINTITESQLADPLAFDTSKVLVFKKPVVKKTIEHDCDKNNPYVAFKDS